MIVIRGDIDSAAVQRIRVHIDGLLADGARFLDIDAAALDNYDTQLLTLLGDAQNRLGQRR